MAHGSILVERRAGSHAAISPTAMGSSVTIVIALGSVGVTPEQERLKHASHGGGRRSAGGDDVESACEPEAEHVATFGPERHAHTDFNPALALRVP